MDTESPRWAPLLRVHPSPPWARSPATFAYRRWGIVPHGVAHCSANDASSKTSSDWNHAGTNPPGSQALLKRARLAQLRYAQALPSRPGVRLIVTGVREAVHDASCLTSRTSGF